MVVAVVPVRVVEAPLDEEVDVVAVGNRLVAAAVAVLVAGTLVGAVTAVGMLLVDLEPVLVDMVAVGVVQVPVVEEVDVALVDHLRVAAARAVEVLTRFVSASCFRHGPNVRESVGVAETEPAKSGRRPAACGEGPPLVVHGTETLDAGGHDFRGGAEGARDVVRLAC